jgi:hypothetical protein
MFAGHLAFMIAALFTGAAFYVSFAEQPARLELDDRALLAQWKLSYRRGFVMQAPLAASGFLLGILAWWITGRLAFVVGAALLLANLPWTIFGVMPTNKVLMETEPAAAGAAQQGADCEVESPSHHQDTSRLRRNPSVPRCVIFNLSS